MTATTELRNYPYEKFAGDLPDELLRMDEPIRRVRLPDGREAWLVLGFEEVCTVLNDARFSRASITSIDEVPSETDEQTRHLNMDGPGHACVRRVASRAFTPRRIEAYRPRVQQLVDELLDKMEAGGQPGDIVSGLVAPLPLLVVCEAIGVPAADREVFYGWVANLYSVTAYGSQGAVQAEVELRAYLAGHLIAKRESPGDDLLSIWVSELSGHELTDPELVELSMGVLLGGIEINSTSAGLRALFMNPEQMDKLRAHPEKISSAVDEIFRYTTVSSMFRVMVVTEDLVMGGTRFRAGDCVMAIPWAANRDPRTFPNPNVFDIERSPNPHLFFGFGSHYCLGAALGKMQVEASINSMLSRYPNLAPAIPMDELPWRGDRVNGGLSSFPVTW